MTNGGEHVDMSGPASNPWLDSVPFARFYRKGDWPVYLGVPLSVPMLRRPVKDKVLSKLRAALDVLQAVSPQQLDRLPSTVLSITVAPAGGLSACWRRELRAILFDPEFVLAPAVTPEWLASTIVHELTHARLERAGFEYVVKARRRIERICLLAERNFIARLPVSAERRRLERINARHLEMRVEYWTDAAFAASRAAWLAKQPLWRRVLLDVGGVISRTHFAVRSSRWG